MHTTKYGTYGPYVAYRVFPGRYEPAIRGLTCQRAGHPPWVQAEAARLQPDAERIEIAEADSGRVEALDARRMRVLDNYEDGLIDRADVTLNWRPSPGMDALEARARVIDFPTIDWSKSPQALNDVLTALFDRIVMDSTMRPTEAVWNVPEWRKA